MDGFNAKNRDIGSTPKSDYPEPVRENNLTSTKKRSELFARAATSTVKKNQAAEYWGEQEGRGLWARMSGEECESML